MNKIEVSVEKIVMLYRNGIIENVLRILYSFKNTTSIDPTKMDLTYDLDNDEYDWNKFIEISEWVTRESFADSMLVTDVKNWWRYKYDREDE